MSGSDTITCAIDGNWPRYPTCVGEMDMHVIDCLTSCEFPPDANACCVAAQCKATQVPNSRKYAKTGSIIGSTGASVNVMCNEGYLGGGTTTCKPDGKFSAVTPCQGAHTHHVLMCA